MHSHVKDYISPLIHMSYIKRNLVHIFTAGVKSFVPPWHQDIVLAWKKLLPTAFSQETTMYISCCCRLKIAYLTDAPLGVQRDGNQLLWSLYYVVGYPKPPTHLMCCYLSFLNTLLWSVSILSCSLNSAH